jgi:hypothetical protein
LVSRLARISRAIRSQRCNVPAASGSSFGDTNAGAPGVNGISQLLAQLQTPPQLSTVVEIRNAQPDDLVWARARSEQRLAQLRLPRDQCLALEQPPRALRSSSSVSPGNAPLKPSPRVRARLISSPV